MSMTSMPDSIALVSVIYAMPVVLVGVEDQRHIADSVLDALMRCSASYGVMVPAISFRQMVWNPMRLSSLHISTYFSTVCTGLWV